MADVMLHGDLQPLFHQLVFECKVHSALYGTAFASLSHCFRLWIAATHGDVGALEVASLRRELAMLRTRVAHAHADAAMPKEVRISLEPPLVGSRLSTSSGGSPSPSKQQQSGSSKELEAFRSARQELQREAAASQAAAQAAAAQAPTGAPAFAGGENEAGAAALRNRLAAAQASAAAWEAAMRHALTLLDPLRPSEAGTPVVDAEVRGDAAAAAASERCLELVGGWVEMMGARAAPISGDASEQAVRLSLALEERNEARADLARTIEMMNEEGDAQAAQTATALRERNEALAERAELRSRLAGALEALNDERAAHSQLQALHAARSSSDGAIEVRCVEAEKELAAALADLEASRANEMNAAERAASAVERAAMANEKAARAEEKALRMGEGSSALLSQVDSLTAQLAEATEAVGIATSARQRAEQAALDQHAHSLSPPGKARGGPDGQELAVDVAVEPLGSGALHRAVRAKDRRASPQLADAPADGGRSLAAAAGGEPSSSSSVAYRVETSRDASLPRRADYGKLKPLGDETRRRAARSPANSSPLPIRDDDSGGCFTPARSSAAPAPLRTADSSAAGGSRSSTQDGQHSPSRIPVRRQRSPSPDASPVRGLITAPVARAYSVDGGSAALSSAVTSATALAEELRLATADDMSRAELADAFAARSRDLEHAVVFAASELASEAVALRAQLRRRGEMLAEREEQLLRREASKSTRQVKVAQKLLVRRSLGFARRALLSSCFRAFCLHTSARQLVHDRRRFREMIVAIQEHRAANSQAAAGEPPGEKGVLLGRVARAVAEGSEQLGGSRIRL